MRNILASIDAGIHLGWYGIEASGDVFPGYGPGGVATFALDFEVGFKVTWSWQTDVRIHQDGTEQRASVLDRPKQHYDGAAQLVETAQRLTRARLARYAAQGAVFLLGLPHEALPLLDDANGAVLTVPAAALASCDWKQPGQRVLVRAGDASIDAVIQDASGSSITLDVAPGVAGAAGGLVMPAMAIYLEPQQNFDRYKSALERWNLSARAAIFDFCPPRASLSLETITGDAAMAGAFLTSRRPGLFGEYTIDFANAAAASLNEIGFATTVFFEHDVTTLADLATLLDSSDNLKLTGTYNPAAVLTLSDEFTATLQGTTSQGDFGDGVALTMYAGQPVWDFPIRNPGTNSEAINAQTDLVDLGGVPTSIGQANYPAWGRAVSLKSSDRADWQKLKLMLATLRGRQGMFWLPTRRKDLTWISTAAGTPPQTNITIETADDVLAWYPAQRDRLMVVQDDGTTTYTNITGTPIDNGDGTTTITVADTISADPVTMLSWLEPCRFEGDDFEITWTGGFNFEMSVMARAFATSAPDVEETA